MLPETEEGDHLVLSPRLLPPGAPPPPTCRTGSGRPANRLLQPDAPAPAAWPSGCCRPQRLRRPQPATAVRRKPEERAPLLRRPANVRGRSIPTWAFSLGFSFLQNHADATHDATADQPTLVMTIAMMSLDQPFSAPLRFSTGT